MLKITASAQLWLSSPQYSRPNAMAMLKGRSHAARVRRMSPYARFVNDKRLAVNFIFFYCYRKHVSNGILVGPLQ